MVATLPPPVKPPPPKSKVPPKIAAPSPAAPARHTKTFSIAPWDGAGEGQKLIIYAASGKGKSTLASMAPLPVFIGLDDGGRMIRHPITGEPIQRVPGVETYQDVRDALHQKGLFAGSKSIVIDTATILELLAMAWVIENVYHEKGASVPIRSIEDYGYGKGYTHIFDAMRLIFQDLDGQVRVGKNVILLCQQCPVVVANAAGTNYLQDGPKLWVPGPDSKQNFTTRGYACEWADHVLKLDYLSQRVIGGGQVESFGKMKEKAGKVSGDTTRAIFSMPLDPSYFAKTRTLTDPVIAFADQKDDSLWRLLFPEEYL